MALSSIEDVLNQQGTLVHTNVGRSMLPLLRQGRDLMVIQKKGSQRCQKYDAVLYKRPSDNHYILHRILEVRENDYVLAGDNNTFKEYGITDAHILGILTAVIRDGKEIPVTDPKYLRYVHLWCDHCEVRMAMLRLLHFPQTLRGRLSRNLKQHCPALHARLKHLKIHLQGRS